MASLIRLVGLAASVAVSSALTIAEINGNKFLSPYNGQTVANVTGVITAKGPDGIWIRSTTPDRDAKTSESIYVFGAKFASTNNLTGRFYLGGRQNPGIPLE